MMACIAILFLMGGSRVHMINRWCHAAKKIPIAPTTTLMTAYLSSMSWICVVNELNPKDNNDDSVKLVNMYTGLYQNSRLENLLQRLICTYKRATLEETHGKKCTACVKANQARQTLSVKSLTTIGIHENCPSA